MAPTTKKSCFFCLYFKIRIFKLIKVKFHYHLPTSEFTYKFSTMVPPTIVTGISVILLRLAYIINRQQIKNNIIFEVPQLYFVKKQQSWGIWALTEPEAQCPRFADGKVEIGNRIFLGLLTDIKNGC